MNGKTYLKENVPTLVVSTPEDVGGMILIDVRRPDEFNGELGHISGSQLHTLGEDLEAHLRSLKSNDPVLFICRSGARSENATKLALELGLENVYNMEGGMLIWNKMGLPVCRN